MESLHRDDLPRGGFAGLREHRLVMGSKLYGDRRDPGTWEGIGHLVYLADARFLLYVTRGGGLVGATAVSDGDLIRGQHLAFEATKQAQLNLVHVTP